MPGLALSLPVAVGVGLQEPFFLDNPGNNTNGAKVIDGQGFRLLTSLVFQLVTDANAANRLVTVEWQGGDGSAYAVAEVTAVQTAGNTNRYVFGLGYGVSSFATGTDGLAPLPWVLLSPGDTLALLVGSKQAGDHLQSIRGTWQRFPFDQYGLPYEQSAE